MELTPNRLVTIIDEVTDKYEPAITSLSTVNFKVSVFPNPTSDMIVVQVNGLLDTGLNIDVINESGDIVKKGMISKGQTLEYLDAQSLYEGLYMVKIYNKRVSTSQKVVIQKE